MFILRVQHWPGSGHCRAERAWEQRVAELKERFTQLPVQVSQTRGLVQAVRAKFFRRIGNVFKVGNLGTQEAKGDVTKRIIKVQ